MKILILKRDKLGDMLLTTPMLQLLRKQSPQSEIHILAPEYSSWVIKGAHFIDRVWEYPRVRTGKTISLINLIKQIKTIIRLRFINFDWAIAAGGEYSKRAVNRLLWIKKNNLISYVPQGSNIQNISHPLLQPNNEHEALRIAKLLKPLNIFIPNDVTDLPFPSFSIPREISIITKKELTKLHLLSQDYMIIGLGARRKKKQPTAQQIMTWSKYAYEAHGLQTVFMWTPGRANNPLYPGDDTIANEILNNKPSYIIPFRGALNPAIGIIWNAKISIFPDSGLMHFAACSPGGVIGLFADIENSPNPNQWGPIGEKSRTIIADKAVSELNSLLIIDLIDNLLLS